MFRCTTALVVIIITAAAQASTPKDEAVQLIREIVGVCETQGMLACEPQIRGVPELFDYVRLFDQIDRLDSQFDRFLRSNAESNYVDFDVLQASINLNLNIKFTAEQFVGRISAVQRVEGGYDVEVDSSQVMLIRQDAAGWYAVFPEQVRTQFEQIQPYYLAGKLKRSILTYRLIEADMVGLSNDQLESKVSEDIAPVMLAIFPKEKFPRLMRWLVKDVNDVVDFYSQFSSVEEMKEHIAITNKLQLDD